ncbi:hypothetical protein [Nocardioides flavescens]|uniref:Uncharacterized protein n=1 Tax=Nocardioides flavescens TaxID=2691959 RepID=A0A6L7F3D1_9ACTN|nr:hypothetical protein [Nocardioides flavescens]MXG91734.1 hypothetical protein [Nocardioides flavescens]
MSPGMHSVPHPHDPPAERRDEIPDLPADEHVDAGRVAEDLALEPEEKQNATDGQDGPDSGTSPA